MSIRFVIAAILLMLALPAVADDSIIGYIKTVKDNGYVIEGNHTTKAVVGTPLKIGNILKTDAHGSMGFTFKDNTVMSVGPDTELTMDEYVYAPNHGNLKLLASITKGTLAYLSGAIAKIKPEAVTVKTPTGTIGVRGTHFVVRVEPN
jgi:hypothetical protein